MTKNWPVDTRESEIEAYAYLRANGLDALDAKFPGVAYALVNKWAERGMIRIKHTADGCRVTTFKKYAA